MLRNILLIILLIALIFGCDNNKSTNNKTMSETIHIAFLHHSTGQIVWQGNTSKIAFKLFKKGDVTKWFSTFNKKNNTNYQIENFYFPKETPYGWKNYPYDYFNIWVKNAGNKEYMEEPTLEMLTKKYKVIIFKHCFPVSNIISDTGNPNVDSEEKRLENYKLQYIKLKEKMKSFPETKFIVWTGAALSKDNTTEDNAIRAREFRDWVIHKWDEPNDNIFIWDFYELETEGGLYLKPEFAAGPKNSHPNKTFAGKIAPLFCNRIVDVIEGRGNTEFLPLK